MQLRESVLREACARFGATRERPLGGSEAALYEVERGGRRHMLRFSSIPEGEKQRFIAVWEFVELIAKSGVRVAAPVESDRGLKIEWITGADETSWAVVCVPWIRGETLNPGALAQNDPAVLQAWGAVMGKMHSTVKDKPKDSRFRDWETEADSMRSLCGDADVRSRWDAMIGSLEALEMNRDTYGLVHNDLHYANILVAGTEVSVVDFDVCNYHFFASDIAIAMQAVLWTEPAGVARDRERWRFVFGNFMRGYRRENAISREWELTIPLFLAHRRLLLFSVFSTEWRDASGWEKTRLDVWRTGILNDVAIVPPDWAAMPIEN